MLEILLNQVCKFIYQLVSKLSSAELGSNCSQFELSLESRNGKSQGD